ncbi:MAG: hypothetical protein NW214_16375 [Pseudanabaenaceae cyanobacterium bins.39]|nr:hypothetical protein [Pseudanabaenaceae cyanobacterium bins.39]
MHHQSQQGKLSKRYPKRYQIMLLVSALTLAIALTVHLALQISAESIWERHYSASLCVSSDAPQAQRKDHSLRFEPIKIVVQPWRGEHHVYAIFAIPLPLQNIYDRSFLKVKGIDGKWYVTVAKPHLYDVKVPEGYFLLVGFVPTRLALLAMILGNFDSLKVPCNWSLFIFPETDVTKTTSPITKER